MRLSLGYAPRPQGEDGSTQTNERERGLIKSPAAVAHDSDTDLVEGGRMRCGDRQHQSAIFATFIYDVRKFMVILFLVTVVLTQLIIIKSYCLLLGYLTSGGVTAQ